MGHPTYRCPEKGSTSQGGDKKTNLVHEVKNVVVSHHELSLTSEEGEDLMIRRMLIKEPIKEKSSQIRSLFKIKCKMMGKVCRFIIKLGSTNNIVLKEVFNKLNIPRIPHTSPYKVTWFNKGQHVLVNEQAWVELSIGRYKEKALGNVLPMVACHFLLCRP